MYGKKHSMRIFVFTLFIFLFCFTAKDSWGKSYSPNVHWIFCIDTSGSMKMKGRMDLLKFITKKIETEFLAGKKNIIKTGDRVTIFSFDQSVRLEATALYQTENDLQQIKYKLKEMNKRSGNLTFISEAIVQAIAIAKKYSQFFDTNALYVFTDGKSEPYSPRWEKKKIEARKKKDARNFKKIAVVGKDQGLSVWLGVLKWEAFDDAKTFVKRMGKGGHLVDLTDFNRLSLERALISFAESVRSNVKITDIKDIDFGTIPYKGESTYQKNFSFTLQTDNVTEPPPITGRITFDPDNPAEMGKDYPVAIKTSESKMVLNFQIAEPGQLKPGTYKGKLDLSPSSRHFGALVIEPSQVNVEFKKSGYLSFYVWRLLIIVVVGFLFLFYLVTKVKKKMPIKV
jgi:hypothetical protein